MPFLQSNQKALPLMFTRDTKDNTKEDNLFFEQKN